jgi:hypothetical protein
MMKLKHFLKGLKMFSLVIFLICIVSGIALLMEFVFKNFGVFWLVLVFICLFIWVLLYMHGLPIVKIE